MLMPFWRTVVVWNKGHILSSLKTCIPIQKELCLQKQAFNCTPSEDAMHSGCTSTLQLSFGPHLSAWMHFLMEEHIIWAHHLELYGGILLFCESGSSANPSNIGKIYCHSNDTLLNSCSLSTKTLDSQIQCESLPCRTALQSMKVLAGNNNPWIRPPAAEFCEHC